jgi:hypothetical protein
VADEQHLSHTHEEIAQNLGSSPHRASFSVTFRLVMASLSVLGTFAFSQTGFEVSDSLISAQRQQFCLITQGIDEFVNLFNDGPFLAGNLRVWLMTFSARTIKGAYVSIGKNLESFSGDNF